MSTPEDLQIDFVTTAADTPLKVEVLEKAALCLLDGYSLARAAAGHEVVVAAHDAVGSPRNYSAASWATGEQLSAADAAFVNGVAIHAFFQDDTDMNTWGHPASVVIPAVAAATEIADAGFPELLRGLVVGYATMSWLAAHEEVARQLVERGFRASPTLGAVAAAMGAASVLGLDGAAVRSALGIAADSLGGTLEPVRAGAQDWRLQNGFAAQRGLTAALAARAGVRGPELPLTGPKGFHSTYCGGDLPATWGRAPDAEAIMEVWFKPYPILGDNMAPAVAASTLTGRVRAEEVEGITIGMNAHFAEYPGTQYAGPFGRVEQAIASTAFGVAAVLLHGPFQYSQYDALLADADLLRLVSLTSIEPDHAFGYLDGTVEVRTTGTTLYARADDAPRESFFRDRATMRDFLVRRGQPEVSTLAGQLFNAVDGATWPAVASLNATMDRSNQ
ncbi:MmgE/PrpD family protein [Tessaracoccus sp. OS52]|uniref:MmgE/PrpD family protein n=1 Tax=Tessaracoccus sp. OS52 TaxID=2886691 RepID=UPI001D1034DB|nr:MmgE/PrpD family protein [Tessaracoccus sp. OS52]MCC2593954.1 MmgE/PrpD family protein [Tessaracoccus sp. OS52]